MSTKNFYPQFPEIEPKKTSVDMATVIAFGKTLVDKYPVEVIRVAYVIFRNESGNGKLGVNNNYGGIQADNDVWEGLDLTDVVGTCVQVDGNHETRRFLCFNDNGYKTCFEFICYKVQQRKMYSLVTATLNMTIATLDKIANDCYRSYQKKWVSNPSEDTEDARKGFVSMYKQSIARIFMVVVMLMQMFVASSQTIDVKHKWYSLVYDTTINAPLMSEYVQTTAHAKSSVKIERKKVASFKQDPLIAAKYQSANDSRYKGNGVYDKGHLAPYAAFEFDSVGAKESMFYTNTAPQYAFFNEHPWQELEMYILKDLSSTNDSIIVQTGCIYAEAKMQGLHVPDYYWKLISYNHGNTEQAWIAPNSDKANPNFHTYELPANKLRSLVHAHYPSLKLN